MKGSIALPTIVSKELILVTERLIYFQTNWG